MMAQQPGRGFPTQGPPRQVGPPMNNNNQATIVNNKIMQHLSSRPLPPGGWQQTVDIGSRLNTIKQMWVTLAVYGRIGFPLFHD